MQRVALLVELVGEEAEEVIDAVSGTSVRFGGMTLGELVARIKSEMPPAHPDSEIAHTVCSDGIVDQGGPVYNLCRTR